MSAQQRSLLLLVLSLAAICAAALAFRVWLDDSGAYMTRVYLERYYAGYMDRLMAQKPFWYFLLPMPDFKGVWATTGFISIYFLEIWIGPHATYLLLTTLATGCYGLGLWLVFRRTLPATVGAAALAFSPFNYSVYLWNGSNNSYVTIAGLALAFGFYGSYVLHEGRRWQLAAGTIFLIVAALSYEIWLNAAAIAILAVPLYVLFLRRWGQGDAGRRAMHVLAAIVALAVLYTLIRARTLSNTAIPGLEFQMVWGHASLAAAFDDFVFNNVFLFYLAISQFLPGFFGTSLAIEQAGRLDPEVLQHGYQPDLYPLVASHYLHLWLMYAGILYAAAVGLGGWLLYSAFRTGAVGRLIFGLIVLALVVGSPTHAILKFVPFNAVPFYAYKATIGVSVGALALACAFHFLLRGAATASTRYAAIAALALWLALVAFTRPAWVNENVLEIWGEPGFFANGFYPDPWQNLKAMLGLTTDG